jgi:hypothetical protein
MIPLFPEETRDVEAVNAIANLPGVPELFGAEAFDFSAAVADERNVFLLHDGALAICEWSAPRVYQCHLIFSPECRRRKAVRAAIAMRDHMFAHHADMLWGQPPLGNIEGRKLIALAGFKHAGFGHHPLVGDTELVTCRQP